MRATPFTIPSFQPKPFVGDSAATIISALQPISYEEEASLSQGIFQQQAYALLDWVVAGITNKLETLSARGNRDWCEYVKDKCVDASSAARDVTHELPPGYQHNFNLMKLSGISHAATMLHLPVQTNDVGIYEWKHYLIDPTLGQFFQNPLLSGHRVNRLIETPEGQKLAKELLTQGYAELTEEKAKLYTSAFIESSPLIEELRNFKGSCIKLLSSPEFDHAIYGDSHNRKALKQPTASHNRF